LEYVILVDKKDQPTGKMEKMEAHIKGSLHRAFSIFVFNREHELMLQQRSFSKYHSPGLWTNTCCSHPRAGEDTDSAAHRRLVEEMGFDCRLNEIFSFVYLADVGNGLTEHEFDHVYTGFTHKTPAINPDEVHDWKFMKMKDIRLDININPENYTVWFKIAFENIEKYIKSKDQKKS
jgi:isopentenyl-diphosphate delta-isomerase